MAVVPRKSAKGKTVFWVAFYDAAGKQKWERVGASRREAEALDRLRRKQVEDGEYEATRKPSMPFGEWLKGWAKARSNRNADEDRRIVEQHLLTNADICKIPCEELRPRHSLKLVDDLKKIVSKATGRALEEKYVANIYGLYRTAVRDARIAELVLVDPCVLPSGALRRKARRGTRTPYEWPEIASLLACPIDEAMVFCALALLTGMREGEICGRRWRDWDRHVAPLGSLHVWSQYNDRPLKTEKGKQGERERRAPVHPVLAKVLEWWWSDGFEFTYCTKPTPNDFIVPRTPEGAGHTKSSAYKLWRKACESVGVVNRSLHSTRHTFITMARRGGARVEVVEKITHNAAGAVIDAYTHWDWAPLCEAVLCLKLLLDMNLDRTPKVGPKSVEAPGIEDGSDHQTLRQLPAEHGSEEPDDEPRSRGIPQSAARHCAGQEFTTGAHTVFGDTRGAVIRHDLPDPIVTLRLALAALHGGRVPEGEMLRAAEGGV